MYRAPKGVVKGQGAEETKFGSEHYSKEFVEKVSERATWVGGRITKATNGQRHDDEAAHRIGGGGTVSLSP